MKTKNKIYLLVTASLILPAVGYLPPVTSLMSRNAWVFCGCFLFMIILLIGKVMESYFAMLTTMALLAVLQVCPFRELASEFASPTLWLCIGVFLMSIGISNSGIGKRVALRILLLFPNTYWGHMTAMLVSGLVTTPVLPSDMAKTSIMAPIVEEVCVAVGAKPGSRASLGLWFPNFMCTCLLGMAFLSGSTNTVIMVEFIGQSFAWLEWIRFTAIWFLVMLALTYVFCMAYCLRDGQKNCGGQTFIKEKYRQLGPLSKKEKQGFAIVGTALIFWITQSFHGISPEIIALLAAASFSLCGMISAREFGDRGMWTTTVFVGGMLGLAKLIQKLGIGTWLAKLMSGLIPHIISSPYLFVIVICLVIYLCRYILTAPMCCGAIFIAVLAPLSNQFGISMFMLVYVVWTSSCCWNAAYTNPAYTALIKMTNGAVDDQTARTGSYAYCVMNLIALLCCIPYWKALMLC